MTSVARIINYMPDATTPEMDDQDSDRSQSAVSDCYSNDDDFPEEQIDYQTCDKEIFETNLSANYKQKLDIAHRYSIDIGGDNTQNYRKVTGNRDGSSNFEVTNSEGMYKSKSMQYDKKNLSHILSGHSASTDFFGGLTKLKEKHSSPNNSTVIESYDRIESESSSSESSQKHFVHTKANDESVNHRENQLSTSVFDLTKKNNKDSYLNAKGDELISDNCLTNIKLQLRNLSENDDDQENFESNVLYSPEGDLESGRIMQIGYKRIKPVICKSISSSSRTEEVFIEQSSQTIESLTNEYSKNKEISDLLTIASRLRENVEEYTQSDLDEFQNLSLHDTLDILKKHVNTILSKNEGPNRSKSQLSDDFAINSSSNSHTCPKNNLSYLYQQIKSIFSVLDATINTKIMQRKKINHRRRYSENIQNKHGVNNDGDISSDHDIESIMYRKESQKNAKKDHYFNNYGHINAEEPLTCRIFELNPYDDLIKSYQSNSDRRVKAVANKMKCKISINGPICMFDSTNACWNMRNKTAFRCFIRGASKELVEKCLKCLQDTFPQSCLNEKRLSCKTGAKNYV